MLFKIITLFLVAMGVLAMFGKLRVGRLGQQGRCRKCGSVKVGRGPCLCESKGR
jgi:predicted MFS family arabinose efflux permease